MTAVEGRVAAEVREEGSGLMGGGGGDAKRGEPPAVCSSPTPSGPPSGNKTCFGPFWESARRSRGGSQGASVPPVNAVPTTNWLHTTRRRLHTGRHQLPTTRRRLHTGRRRLPTTRRRFNTGSRPMTTDCLRGPANPEFQNKRSVAKQGPRLPHRQPVRRAICGPRIGAPGAAPTSPRAPALSAAPAP